MMVCSGDHVYQNSLCRCCYLTCGNGQNKAREDVQSIQHNHSQNTLQSKNNSPFISRKIHFLRHARHTYSYPSQGLDTSICASNSLWMCGHPNAQGWWSRSHPHAWNTLQLGKTTKNSSTIQHWEPWFSKATGYLVLFKNPGDKEGEGSAFPEFFEPFHTLRKAGFDLKIVLVWHHRNFYC